MLLVFDPYGERLYHLPTPSFASRAVVRRWDELHRFTPVADCTVVLLRDLDASDDLACLEGYRRRFPAQPLVLVVACTAANVRHLPSLAGCEMVWLEEVERVVSRAVRRAIRNAPPREDADTLAEPPPAAPLPYGRLPF